MVTKTDKELKDGDVFQYVDRPLFTFRKLFRVGKVDCIVNVNYPRIELRLTPSGKRVVIKSGI